MSSFSEMKLGEFIQQAASNSPTPGGGGIAALSGALGAAMAAMAANFTIGKPKYAQYDAMMRETIAKLETLIDDLRRAIDEDAEAFSKISEAYGLPKDDDEQKAARKQAVNDALRESMRVPIRVLRSCVKVAELLPSLAGASNTNLLSDVEVAGIMIDAAARAAYTNILVNSRQLQGEEFRVAERESEELMKHVIQTASEVTSIISGRNV